MAGLHDQTFWPACSDSGVIGSWQAGEHDIGQGRREVHIGKKLAEKGKCHGRGPLRRACQGCSNTTPGRRTRGGEGQGAHPLEAKWAETASTTT